MRLVAWNCRSGLHRKLDVLASLAPDVAIVPESASLDILTRKAPGLVPTSAAWVGANHHKGLAVFAFGEYQVAQYNRYDASIGYALPVRVDGPSTFHLVGLWAHYGLTPMRIAVPGPTLQALTAYREFLLARPSSVAGDFNNHQRWDKPGKASNHVNTLAACAQLGLVSAYHAFHGLEHGAERDPTFYWRTRSADCPTFHIDYAFVPADSLCFLRSVSVGSREAWIGPGLSDHAPLIVDFDPAFGA
jgi:exodeoxyribonuclease-3